MRLTLKETIDKANTFGTLTGLQEALEMSNAQIALRIDCAEIDWITAKNYDRARKDWLRALRWLLVEKWLHDEEVVANKIGLDDSETLYEGDTPENGKIVLARWSEGFVLRYHGGIVWRSWKDATKQAKLTLNARAFMEANDKSPVVFADARDNKLTGERVGHYVLEDNSWFDLSTDDARTLPEGYPIWKLPESKPAEPTDQDLVNAMHRHMVAIRELRTQLYARDIKIEFNAQSEAANNPWIYARFTKQMAPKDP